MQQLKFRLLQHARIISWYADYVGWNMLHAWRKRPLPTDVKRILVIEIKFVGDLIVSTPVFAELKKKYPNAEIDLVVPKGMADVLYGNPHLSKIIEWGQNIEQYLPEIKDTYDLAIMLHPGSYRMSKLLKSANIPFRIGATRAGILEGKGFFVQRKTRPTKEWKLKIFDNLDVIKALGITTDEITPEVYVDKGVEKVFLKKLPEKYVVVHAAPNHKTHEWFVEKWAEVIDSIKEPVVLTGSTKDQSYNKMIMMMFKVHKKEDVYDFSGTSLKELFVIIKHADKVLSVDTGTMHIAAAFNKKTIALFGAGDPRVWKPFTKNTAVLFHGDRRDLCTSCMRHVCQYENTPRNRECMQAITIEEVTKEL